MQDDPSITVRERKGNLTDVAGLEVREDCFGLLVLTANNFIEPGPITREDAPRVAAIIAHWGETGRLEEPPETAAVAPLISLDEIQAIRWCIEAARSHAHPVPGFSAARCTAAESVLDRLAAAREAAVPYRNTLIDLGDRLAHVEQLADRAARTERELPEIRRKIAHLEHLVERELERKRGMS